MTVQPLVRARVGTQIHAPTEIALPSGPMTVAEVIDLFLGVCAKTAQNQRALAERVRLLQLFRLDFGGRMLGDLRPVDLVLWLNRHPGWRSDWTILRVIRTIQRPFNWCADLGVIDRNPLRTVSHCQGERGRPIEPAELRTILRLSDACFRRVLIFLRLTGCRPGELRVLERRHIQFERSCALLREHKTARTRKDRHPRPIILHPVAVKLLIWILRRAPAEQQLLFVNSNGQGWTRSALNLRLYRLRKRAGLDPSCKLYGCRHAFATQAAMNGVDLSTLAELLGHTTTRMAEHYIHIAGQTVHLQEAVRKAIDSAQDGRSQQQPMTKKTPARDLSLPLFDRLPRGPSLPLFDGLEW